MQLDLFGGAAIAPSPVEAPSEPPPREPALPQIGLFDASLERRRRAHQRLLGLDAVGAEAELAALMNARPDLPEIAAERDVARDVASLLAAAEGARTPAGRARALVERIDRLTLHDRPAPVRWLMRSVSSALQIRLGETIEEAGGVVDGCSAGRAFLRGGALERAAAVLGITVLTHPAAVHFLDLADAHHALGELRLAREAYLAAFLLDPLAATEAVADPEAREALIWAETELDDPRDPREWAPVAGVILGVLPCRIPERIELPHHTGARFFALLVAAEAARAKGTTAVQLRRQMRELSAGAFARYLEWIGGGERTEPAPRSRPSRAPRSPRR